MRELWGDHTAHQRRQLSAELPVIHGQLTVIADLRDGQRSYFQGRCEKSDIYPTAHPPAEHLSYTRVMTAEPQQPRVGGRLPLLALFAVMILAALAASLFSIRQARMTSADDEAPLLVSVFDTYASEPLTPYGVLRDAIENEDAPRLRSLAFDADGYSSYLAARELASLQQLPAGERLDALERALELRVDDSLRRAENRDLQLLRARLAREADRPEVAVEAYKEALALPAAREELAEIVSDPYALAAAYLGARWNTLALEALGDLTAPSIEAPALRALGRYEEALDAYRRWAQTEPGNEDVALGAAWCLFYLGRDAEAMAAFSALGSAGNYGLGLLANRAGDIDRAVELLRLTGRADVLWLATGILEARDRFTDALPIYLELAGGGSSYADDAAYRAYVLGNRLARPEIAERAKDLLPPGNFFAMLLGSGPMVPDPATASVATATTAPVEDPVNETLALASALYAVHEEAAAVGELLFGLRRAEQAGDVDEILDLAEMLQSMDEYRHSVSAARTLLNTGNDDLRVWRLAYPPAWPELVITAADEEGVEPGLIWAVMRQESAFSEVAVSVANAQGLMQVIPSTWDWIAELRDESPRNPFDIAANVDYGATYLAWLDNYFDGDIELVIASYNGGQGYVRRLFESEWVNLEKDEFYREIDRSETREYLQRVYENLSVYRTLYPSIAEIEGQQLVLASSAVVRD